MSTERKSEKLSHKHESVNEKLWRGEIEVQELLDLLGKVPPDAKVRIYGNKLQIMSPADNKVYTLDKVR